MWRGWHAYACLPLLSIGDNCRAATMAAHSQNAVAAGLGRGEAAAALGNLRSLASMFVMPAYGSLYAVGDGRLAWWLAAGFGVLSAALASRVAAEDINRSGLESRQQ